MTIAHIVCWLAHFLTCIQFNVSSHTGIGIGIGYWHWDRPILLGIGCLVWYRSNPIETCLQSLHAAMVMKQRHSHFVKYCRQIATFLDFNTVLHFVEKRHYAFWIAGKITHLRTTDNWRHSLRTRTCIQQNKQETVTWKNRHATGFSQIL